MDEEGLLKPIESAFFILGAHQPFAGNGIVVGTDEDGETTDCESTVDDIKARIKFLTLKQLQEKAF